MIASTSASAVTSSASQRAARTAAARRVPKITCATSSHKYDKLATRMARDIAAKLTGRASTVGLKEIDSKTGVTCAYHPTWHFYAASAIKATILGALLRMAQEQGRHLTRTERSRAWLMITQSNNDAATDLWNEVGMRRMQHFLNLAKMKHTVLASAWGLSLLTAHDEILLLTMLSGPNRILSEHSRVYAQYLMSHVISSQRWGVPAGAPSSVSVHVKNGWLPYPVSSNWVINSIGFFVHHKPYRKYEIVMLTHANPSMAYGIDTIEDAAQPIHRDLNPGSTGAIGESKPKRDWGIPDERIRHQ
ncbi:MAG: serine hydrolase [Streptosporangiaceae bacterium]